MADFEVHIDLGGRTSPIGLARSNRARVSKTIVFERRRRRNATWRTSLPRFQRKPATTSIETWEEIALRLASNAGIAPRSTNWSRWLARPSCYGAASIAMTPFASRSRPPWALSVFNPQCPKLNSAAS